MKIMRMRELYIVNEIEGGLVSWDRPLLFVWRHWRSCIN
jgi:hypothetical protein